MKDTPAQRRAKLKYLAEKTDDIRLRVPKGTKDRWRQAAESQGISMTKFVVQCVESNLTMQATCK